MASKETLGRIRHINLTTQQRRLRHLHSVSARNIKPSFQLSGDTLLEHLLETFFTLHIQESSSPAIYTSEKIPYSLNPTWASFELNALNDSLQTSTSLLVVRLWGGHQSRYRLLIEWKVDLKLLQYLGDQIRTAHHPANTLIFGLVDGYYGAPVVTTPIPKNVDSAPLNNSIYSSIKVELDQVTPSYSIASLIKLSSLQRTIRKTQISVQECQQLIEDRLLTTEKSMLQLAKRESLRLKVKLLQEELLSKVGVVTKEKEEEKKMSHTIKKRERLLAKKRKDFEEKNLSLREHKQVHVDKRESLVKLNAQLSMRKRQLACELTHIYPITTLIKRSGEQSIEENYICSIRLPNSESSEFFSTDDEKLSCSLGYTCHLVFMISKIMEIPLRYAMNPMGSRSTIMDYAMEKVVEKDKEFPLYSKGKEKIQFHYGIFLLNKNIAQLRQYYNLPTPNLRKTLPNLKDILIKKFQASSEPLKSTLYAINEQTSLKPQLDTKSNDSSPSKPKTDRDVFIENMKSNDGSKPPLMLKLAGSTSPAKPPLMPKPAGSTSIDGHPSESASQPKPRLMPKPAGSTSIDEYVDVSTSPTKPPLPPKPGTLSRSIKDKHGLVNSENELLSIVSIRYDIPSDQDTDDQRQEGLPGNKIQDIANNGTIKVSVDAAAIKPRPQGATHKFFERRPRKKSTPAIAAQAMASKAEKKKKRRSLQEVSRGVPVEVMRERAAFQAKLNEQRNQMERQAVESGVQSGSTSESSTISNDMTTINSSTEPMRDQDTTSNTDTIISS